MTTKITMNLKNRNDSTLLMMTTKTLLETTALIQWSLLIMIGLMPIQLAIAKTVDNLTVGDKNKTVFINTDQVMTKDGAVITNLDAVQEAFNTSSEQDNIKVCAQSKTAICKLRLRERMPAVMTFNEDVRSFVLGDGLNFAFSSVDGSRNIYKLEGYYPGADTNLTIVGESGLIYSFYIRIDSIASKFVSDFVVNVYGNPLFISSSKEALIKQRDWDAKNPKQFSDKASIKVKEAHIKAAKETTKKAIDYLDTKPNVQVEHLNFNFEIVNGDQALMPKSVFDDGLWTYWQYGNQNLNTVDKLPVPYAVVDGHDMPVNSRIEGGYLITEGVSQKWTLRSGERYACVKKFE
jgi:type IV secretory pathway VirB9-like protein